MKKENVRFYIDKNHYYEGEVKITKVSKLDLSDELIAGVALEGTGTMTFKTVPWWDRVKRFLKQIYQNLKGANE